MFSLRAILGRSASHRDERLVSLRFRTSTRIARGVSAQVEKLLSDDKAGETYRAFTAFWNRSDRPPLERYLGVSSTCTIYGPLQEAQEGHPYHCLIPAGGVIESPGITLPLSPDEADNVRICIIDAIEETILHWLVMRGEDEEEADKLHFLDAQQEELSHD